MFYDDTPIPYRTCGAGRGWPGGGRAPAVLDATEQAMGIAFGGMPQLPEHLFERGLSEPDAGSGAPDGAPAEPYPNNAVVA